MAHIFEHTKGGIEWDEDPAAPLLVADIVENATVIDGAFQVTLAVRRISRDAKGEPKTRARPVAHVRLSPATAKALVDALRGCFELATTPLNEPAPKKARN